MALFESVLYLMCSALFVAAQQNDLVNPCRMDDMECIRDTTQQFLEKTSKGIPELGIKPIDPLEVAKLDYDLDKFGCSHHVTNLKIVGLKQLQVTAFQMDTTNKKIALSLNISVTAEGDIAVDYHVKPKPKTVSGHYTSEFKFLATTRYPYSVKNGEDGAMHYEVGPEVTTFEIRGAPKYELSEQFLSAINADAQLSELRNSMLASQGKELSEAILKQMVDVIVPTLVQNLRQSAKALPITAFFKTD